MFGQNRRGEGGCGRLEWGRIPGRSRAQAGAAARCSTHAALTCVRGSRRGARIVRGRAHRASSVTARKPGGPRVERECAHGPCRATRRASARSGRRRCARRDPSRSPRRTRAVATRDALASTTRCLSACPHMRADAIGPVDEAACAGGWSDMRADAIGPVDEAACAGGWSEGGAIVARSFRPLARSSCGRGQGSTSHREHHRRLLSRARAQRWPALGGRCAAHPQRWPH